MKVYEWYSVSEKKDSFTEWYQRTQRAHGSRKVDKDEGGTMQRVNCGMESVRPNTKRLMMEHTKRA